MLPAIWKDRDRMDEVGVSMTELSQTIAKKVLLFLLVCLAIQGRALDPDVGQTVFDVVPLQEDAFSGRLDPVADVGFTISDRLGTFAGGIRLVPASGVPKHYVGASSEFRWRLFKDGAMAAEGAWSDAAHGTGLTINHDFQRGANYTLIAGYYHFGSCPGIIYRPAPCLAADVQLRWRIQPEGTNLPDLSTSGDCPYELAFDGPDTDPLPRACTFRYLDRELAVSFDHTSSEWEDYDSGKATNYNSRIVLADRYETVHWILRGDHNFNYTQTLSTAIPGGADPKVFIMPDLSENATMQTVETGYTLYVQVEDAYGVTGSATPQLITSLRDLRIPNVLSWTLNFSENPRPITQTEQVGIAGLHKSLTSCYFPYDLHQNVGFQLAQWGPSSLRLAPPESDYSLSYALYLTADILGGGTGVLGLPANNGHELHIQDFEDRYTWKSNDAGPGYPEDDYIEIGLYQVIDERSTNMVSAGDQPLNVNDWRAGNYPHRLRLHAREGSDSACQVPSSVTFFEDNAPVDTYYVTSNQDTLEVDFRADWDLFQFPDDHFRGLKVTFERNGQPIDNVQVENPWSACTTGNPILHRIQEHHLRIHDPGRLDGATMKIGLIHIDQDTDCAIEVPDVTGSVRLAVDDNGIDSFGGLFFTSSNDSMHGNLPVGKVDPSGIVDFSFSADATGTPVFVEWLWYKQNPNGTCVYWNGSAWNGFACPEPDEMPAEGSQVGSSIQAFSGRWVWDQVDIAPDPTKLPPFEGELESLFGIADGIEVTVLARVRFTGGHSQIGRTTFYLQPDTVTPTRFTGLRVGQGPGTSHDASVSYAVGEAETVTFQIGTNDTSDQAGFHQVRVFLSELASPDNPITPPSCDALSTHAGTISFMDLGAGNSYYTFNLGAGSLRDRLNQPGIYRMAIYPEPDLCSGILPVSMKVTLTVTDPNGSPDPTIQPDLLVRLHYRDHLGSSMTAKAFSVAGDTDGGTLLMTPTGGTSFMLLGRRSGKIPGTIPSVIRLTPMSPQTTGPATPTMNATPSAGSTT